MTGSLAETPAIQWDKSFRGAPRPVAADYTVAQRWQDYGPEDHAVWRTLFERQSRLLPGRACPAFVEGLEHLPFGAEAIPDFEALSERLERATGWRVVAVPGLVPDAVFFEHLANRRFPAAHWIRRRDELDYLEEPDLFHDIFGHVPMLVNPVFADYLQAYGQGGLRALGRKVLHRLARLYWYTVEFGLVQGDRGLEIYGAGIVSSHSETIFAREDASPNRIAFDLERVMRTRYRIDDFQESYFVVRDFEELLGLAEIDFAPLYDRVAALEDIEPGALLEGDRLLHRGSGRYHAARRRPAA
ncbi:Phenylalanine 4-hydroxylase [Tistlia consotensis]|uniref:Phenylalanine-4-hydroxylase n=1 Tax=Tistlia consotensis USBA 355 TaxID=560819 RepID=A0A1Y6B4L3_9PROT|nr:phenylalanine 4-monooxygenase [Tistlia consotensis]SME89019.1 Phenylalanine 4-hydroxylase [Tistlia consotensis USBA 355]SNR25581.1 Phenylalanine 4-hydroxylase [Tistlia consotensis]